MNRQSYDIVVIGAGPAGLNACLHALAACPGCRVLLADKTAPWEHPIECAEAVGRLGFTEAIRWDKSWIRHTISRAAFHSPDNTEITYTDNDKGFIIDRGRMQRDMARQCGEKGAELALDCAIVAVSAPGKNGMRTVTARGGASVGCRVVVDASGPLSFIGRNEGIAWKAPDLEPAYFAFLENAPVSADTVHIYVGEDVAPFGYAWHFPGGDGLSNAGVLVGSGKKGAVNIRELLHSFIRKNFPGAKPVRFCAGTIPCGFSRRVLAVPGLIKSGDAASTINPISRAGIVEALLSGGIAGDHAVKMLLAHKPGDMKKICLGYEKEWFVKRGGRHYRLARVKPALARIPDRDYDGAAHRLANLPQDKLTMSRIFRASLGRSPRLVWAMRHLII